MNDRQILRCIGKNIKQARIKAEMTQECLAELIGVHWKTLSNIERGLFPFSVASFTLIAQHLGVTADSLLSGIDPPDAKRAAGIRKAMARKRRPKGSTKG